MSKRILLDENVPFGLTALLAPHEARHAIELGWAGITNGQLLDEAERAGFQVMVTADSNIKAQQLLAGRRIALVVLPTNHWLTVRASAGQITFACHRAAEGSYSIVPMPRPQRRRRSSRPFEQT